MVRAAHRGGGHPGQIRTHPRLGHRDRGDQLAGSDPRQPPAALLAGGQVQEIRLADVVVQDQTETRAGDSGMHDLLSEYRIEPEIRHSAAAELLRDRHSEKPSRARGGEQLSGHDSLGFPGFQMGRHLLGQKCPNALPESLMISIEQLAAHAPIVLRHRASPP